MSTSDVIIGLEIHLQVTTSKTKMFCSCSSDYRNSPPNTNICPICLGLPGTLPRPNKYVVDKAIQLAFALGSEISEDLVFARKHYFYPDLPKGYQISQYTIGRYTALARGGSLEISLKGYRKNIRIRRINIEEDPAKIIYPEKDPWKSPYVLIDYNRSGIPLIEVATEPDLESAEEAVVFVEKLLELADHLNITDPTLEGAFRVDANISVRGGERVEIKNIGSLKDLNKAISFEIIRQKRLREIGERITRETRHWDPVRGATISARHKEFEEEYKYMPDPDIPPIKISREYLEKLRISLPELPWIMKKRFIEKYSLTDYEAGVLVSRKWLAKYFEETVSFYNKPDKVADLLINDFLGIINEAGGRLDLVKAKPKQIAELLELLDKKVISIKILKEILPRVIFNGEDPRKIINEMNFTVISEDTFLEEIAEKVIRDNPKAVEDVKKNPKAINFLVGQVMKLTKGRADPDKINRIIRRKLGLGE
ncbi:MAG: Asp-tRNA(Asn)/Glu-tRNA(Gln) amidotransferase subunit GatB [Sulfolobales archaeon]